MVTDTVSLNALKRFFNNLNLDESNKDAQLMAEIQESLAQLDI